ncbi:MAG: lipid A biosynthesis acyltransferase, partial [Betaproteobacteria bacterium]
MRLVLFLLWCLRWLPRGWVAAMGRGLGTLLFHWGRRRVTLINLKLCFPQLSEAERENIGRGVFQNLARSTLELGRVWYSPVDTAL